MGSLWIIITALRSYLKPKLVETEYLQFALKFKPLEMLKNISNHSVSVLYSHFHNANPRVVMTKN